jgi:ABC-type nitrate/sulfonate/bicarbonate transport system ATPase subunit
VEQFVAFATELRLDFDLSRRTSELSGGEQQLFLLVRALIRSPGFLVFDEPLSAIDYGRKEIIRNYLGRYLAQHNSTFVFASHEFDDAVLLADRILVLAREAEGVKLEIPVPLPWPRTTQGRDNPVFRDILGRVTEAVL